MKGGGGYHPFPLTFWATDHPLRGGGSTPPFPLRKNPPKIRPNTMFFGQKTPFLATKFLFSATDCPLRGGEYPLPLSINFFPLTFRENVVRDGLGAEVNISSRNQYFCTCPKMALHGFPGRLGSWTVIFLHEAQEGNISAHSSNISARTPPKKLFLCTIEKETC